MGLAIEELAYFRQAGGQTIVDVTPIGARVNRPDLKHGDALRHVSQTAGINIVAGTSFMYEPMFPDQYRECSAEEMAAVMVSELTEGTQGTGARAGIIGEVGSGGGEDFTPLDTRLFQAAALAHHATGAAVSTHTFAGRLGLRQVRLLESAGVDPSRIVIGHLDSGESMAVDWPYHIEIALTGACVAYDLVGWERRKRIHSTILPWHPMAFQLQNSAVIRFLPEARPQLADRPSRARLCRSRPSGTHRRPGTLLSVTRLKQKVQQEGSRSVLDEPERESDPRLKKASTSSCVRSRICESTSANDRCSPWAWGNLRCRDPESKEPGPLEDHPQPDDAPVHLLQLGPVPSNYVLHPIS